MKDQERPKAQGRGSQINPVNRFETVHFDEDLCQIEDAPDYFAAQSSIKTEYFPDQSKSIISENDSPDVGFRFSLNPYRGCSHGCAYCYARPSHEYLGFNAGLDFESKVTVKERAPQLFRDWLSRDRWVPELIAFSGVTDCYQPCEREFQLTRACLKVALEARQPVGIITKNALVCRDLDVLKEMSAFNVAAVSLSITTLDKSLARSMEPRTSTPEARLRAVSRLAEAGIRTSVMIGPVIPGLTDSEIPRILKAAAEAGAYAANFIVLRLPSTVRPVFFEWLEREQPMRQSVVASRIRSTRDGGMSDSAFGKRMRGTGEIASQIEQTFRVFAKKFGLDRKRTPLSTDHFRAPTSSSGQRRLF